MKRLTITLLLLLSSLSVHAQRDYYERYAKRPDLAVSYVQGYLMEGNHRLDVVILQPLNETDSAFTALRRELHCDRAAFYQHLPQRNGRTDWRHAYVAACNPRHQLITLFFPRNDKELKAIVEHHQKQALAENKKQNKK